MEELKDILKSERELKGLSLEKLSLITGIPARFLEYLENGRRDKLPPDTYVRGYLMKLAEVYSVDGNGLWEMYKREKGDRLSSGAKDHFPGSHSSEKSVSPWRRAVFSAPAVIFAAAFVYIVFQGSGLIRPPRLIVKFPEADSTVNNPEFIVSGSIFEGDSLTINDESVFVGDDGTFEKRFTLQEGLNEFTLRARTLLGRETVAVRRMRYVLSPPGGTAPISEVSQGVDETSTVIENNQ
ncbi:MAG: hypothetical protein A2939_00475 [Parcubacteria group bacterium RIFCSPLOWO2_01_FULL_48_18]|nr:MAG: hypothetical protein A2939_00475 [Parcubacteria group bacterium RIFCSPLOWO2_01_FULL_48_18]